MSTLLVLFWFWGITCNCSHVKTKVMDLQWQNQNQKTVLPQYRWQWNKPEKNKAKKKKMQGETHRVDLLEPSLSSQGSEKADTGWCFEQEPPNRLASYKTCQIIPKTKQESLGQLRPACVCVCYRATILLLKLGVFNMQMSTREVNPRNLY